MAVGNARFQLLRGPFEALMENQEVWDVNSLLSEGGRVVLEFDCGDQTRPSSGETQGTRIEWDTISSEKVRAGRTDTSPVFTVSFASGEDFRFRITVGAIHPAAEAAPPQRGPERLQHAQ